MAFSTLPDVAKKIKLFLGLAPVATIAFTSSPMTKLSVLPEVLMWVSLDPSYTLSGDIYVSYLVTPLINPHWSPGHFW